MSILEVIDHAARIGGLVAFLATVPAVVGFIVWQRRKARTTAEIDRILKNIETTSRLS